MNFVTEWINNNVVLNDNTISFPAQEYLWFINTFDKLPALNTYVFINCNEDQDVVGIYFTQNWGNKLLELVKEIFFREMMKDFE